MKYIEWQGTPGKHALHLVRTLCNPEWLQQPKWLPDEIVTHPAKPLYYGDKKLAKWKYDKHMAYPPCFSIKLGVGEPMWLSTRYPRISIGLPGLWHAFNNDTDMWLWSPEAQVNIALLESGKYTTEAWLWPESHHVLDPVYSYLRWWHNESDPGSPARTLIKQTYTRLIGLLAHHSEHEQEGYIFRPDWRNMILSEARVRLEAQITRVRVVEGIEPIAVKVDALYYEHRITSLPLGENIGNFREVEL